MIYLSLTFHSARDLVLKTKESISAFLALANAGSYVKKQARSSVLRQSWGFVSIGRAL